MTEKRRVYIAQRVREHRQRLKADGFTYVHVPLSSEYKELLDKYCLSMQTTQARVICYLLDCADEQILPETEKPFE